MKHVLAVVGTRPEAIKMAPLIRRLQATAGINTTVCLTGQHREMVRQVFDMFGLEAGFDLDVMQPNQSLAQITEKVLTGMSGVLEKSKPDIVLVHGDTTTTLAAALAAYYHKIAVGHVEAGLRTGDIYAPWPEEINRKLTDAIARELYAPTQGSKENLLREGYPADRILVTGNTVIDALLDMVNGPLTRPDIRSQLAQRYGFIDPKKRMVLVTCHRRESYGEGFRYICEALEQLARRPDVQIVFPIHMNPNVRGAFSRLAELDSVRLIEPVQYLDFVYLLTASYCVLTDSGGIQEEAPSLGKPVLVMRQVTERPEAVAAGTVKLVGADREKIVQTAFELLDDQNSYAAMSGKSNPYGDGKASERIIASLMQEHSNAK